MSMRFIDIIQRYSALVWQDSSNPHHRCACRPLSTVCRGTSCFTFSIGFELHIGIQYYITWTEGKPPPRNDMSQLTHRGVGVPCGTGVGPSWLPGHISNAPVIGSALSRLQIISELIHR